MNSPSDVMDPAHIFLPEEKGESGEPFENKGAAAPHGHNKLTYISREEVLSTLRTFNGVVSRAAERLGVSRRALYYHLKKLRIDPNALREIPHKLSNKALPK